VLTRHVYLSPLCSLYLPKQLPRGTFETQRKLNTYHLSHQLVSSSPALGWTTPGDGELGIQVQQVSGSRRLGLDSTLHSRLDKEPFKPEDSMDHSNQKATRTQTGSTPGHVLVSCPTSGCCGILAAGPEDPETMQIQHPFCLRNKVCSLLSENGGRWQMGPVFIRH
jgi:hypothetical protein